MAAVVPLLLSALLFSAVLAHVVLVPDVAEFFHPEALVIGVVPRKVAVRLETDGRVCAGKHKLFVVTHGGG